MMMKNILPTTVNLPGTVKTAPVSVSEKDYNSSDQALLDDLSDDMIFYQADARDCIGGF